MTFEFSLTLKTIPSIQTIRYTSSKGRFCQATTSLATALVIREMVEVETSKSYISRICSSMSDTLIPLAYNEIMMFSKPSIMLCLLGTKTGSKLPSLSLGTLISDSPKEDFIFLVP
ncbi:hypothetical protein D3C71_1520560 [compost metagenome]